MEAMSPAWRLIFAVVVIYGFCFAIVAAGWLAWAFAEANECWPEDINKKRNP